MKISTFAAFAALTVAGPALAGSVGAGPGGTASSVVGSIVSSASQTAAMEGTPRPGAVGQVILEATQAASLAAYLQSQQGTTVSGSLITAPTVFADGTSGVITLDTSTGALTLTRL